MNDPKLDLSFEPKPPVVLDYKDPPVVIGMCQEPNCVIWAGHPKGEHRSYRVSQLACPHNVPNFGPSCPVCD
jgi:hypothetical protein